MTPIPTMHANVRAIMRGFEITRNMRRANYPFAQYSADRGWNTRLRRRLRVLSLQRSVPRAASSTRCISGRLSASRSGVAFVDDRAVFRSSAVGEWRCSAFRCSSNRCRVTRKFAAVASDRIAHRLRSRTPACCSRVSISGAKPFASRSVLPRLDPGLRYRRRAGHHASVDRAASRGVPMLPSDDR